MNDLRNLLDDLAGDPTHPTLREVDADLQRGRLALRRRRSRRAAGSLTAIGVLSVIGVAGQVHSRDAASEVTVQPARPATAPGPVPSPRPSTDTERPTTSPRPTITISGPGPSPRPSTDTGRPTTSPRPTEAQRPTPSPYVSPGSPLVAIPKTGSKTLMVQRVPVGWAVTRREADLLEVTPKDPRSTPGKIVIAVGSRGEALPERGDATSVISGVNESVRGVFLPARSASEQPQFSWIVKGGTANGRIVRISGSGVNWKDDIRWVEMAGSVLVGSWTYEPAETPRPSVTPSP